ncbi:MAG: hypothetical protein K2G31_05150 [Clostridia bacterium]|nr:hypothetical protein [Clostridia bacterium]
MKKKIVAIVAVVALVAVLGICLVACNSNTVGDKLEKKGYTVSKLNEDSTGVAKTIYNTMKNNSDFKEGVSAAKDSDYVIVLWFETKDAATSVANDKIINLTSTVKQVEKVVYIGTEQGVKDAQ